jgi:protein-disulfide isomerase
MTIKKTGKTEKKTTKPRSKAMPKSEPKPHIVEEKLNEALQENVEMPQNTVPAFSPDKRSFPWWGVLSLILILVFGTIMLYENHQGFRQNLNNMINATGLVKIGNAGTTSETGTVAKQDPFQMKMTIIYNQEDQVMKQSIEKYLTNIETNLQNTKVSATWLDKNDPKAKELISKLNSKYLPVFVTDESITKHPQYSAFSQAVIQKNGEYQFQSEGMEYLEIPKVGGARYLGAKPDKAKVVVMEYASFSCGYCKAMYPILQKMIKQYGDKVSLVIKHYNRGGIDVILAQSVECAADQGKLDSMMAKLYDKEGDFYNAMQNQEDPEKAVYEQLKDAAKQAGANSDKVLECVKSGKYADLISKDTNEGLAYGIFGTPSLFINQKFLGGAVEEPAFFKLIETELNK